MSDLIDWPDVPPGLLFDCVISQEVAAQPGMIATREVDAVGEHASVTWWGDQSPGSPLLGAVKGDVVTVTIFGESKVYRVVDRHEDKPGETTLDLEPEEA